MSPMTLAYDENNIHMLQPLPHAYCLFLNILSAGRSPKKLFKVAYQKCGVKSVNVAEGSPKI